jgi:hypothetical protein
MWELKVSELGEYIKLLDLPYLHVGIIPFKISPFGTSYIAVSNAAPPVSRCFSPPPAIQLEFLQYPRIFVYLTGFSSVWKRTPYTGILSSFDLTFSDLVRRKYVLFLVSFSRCDTNCKTIRLMFKFSTKTLHRVSYSRPRMTQTSLVIQLSSLCMTWRNFSLRNRSDFKTGELNIQTSQTKFGQSCDMLTI